MFVNRKLAVAATALVTAFGSSAFAQSQEFLIDRQTFIDPYTQQIVRPLSNDAIASRDTRATNGFGSSSSNGEFDYLYDPIYDLY